MLALSIIDHQMTLKKGFDKTPFLYNLKLTMYHLMNLEDTYFCTITFNVDDSDPVSTLM